MKTYNDYKVYYGDIHTHCGISYGHGSLEDALKNAREQLDFCSVTGHAHWHDMPEPDERIQYIIDFHKKGFQKLKNGWNDMLETLKKYNKDGRFLVFPGFEIHSNSDGDRTVVYKDITGEIIYAENIAQLHEKLKQLKEKGIESLSFPHHIGYKTGTRGINWSTFDGNKEPVAELISMHGCSEKSENTRPFLHSMGPADWESTIQYGLKQGHIFGFCANTDHHSAHPGSYGHGRTALWAEDLSRDALWQAFYQRRTYALTGDRIDLKFALNAAPMGSIIPACKQRDIDISVSAGSAIDYVDIVKDNRLLKRFSQCDFDNTADQDCETVKTKIHLELGWGERGKTTDWEVELEIDEGEILDIEPRFRGREVVSPVEKKDNSSQFYTSTWQRLSEKSLKLSCTSESNPNNSTCTTQGICLEIQAPRSARIKAVLNGKREVISLQRLMEGAYTGSLGSIDSPAYKFNRAPRSNEMNWNIKYIDTGTDTRFDIGHSFYYIRVKQQNDQWAWSSPVFVKK
ncbi:hypothetical protein SMSP2_01426 [Limihaloglobus sulfuriphilus]|uniref:DUF3604 domain-containing protein n=1 Tax=Limihaloglobus sulfuriphilus TaxID=1851148 RepID=A0A1Q2MFN6_9BACT|nr:DUF3604 domain-containing protein [Limihaloglobus sulfuriphilus]AQQ71062.1 hypothetical protein SMSP2_01426 [Limihaloglobus sulfuriphilus]